MGSRGSHRRREGLKRRLQQVETVCWLCGFPLDNSASPFTDFATEIDEEIPVSMGGDYYGVDSPCHLTHRCCNIHKGNKELKQGELRDWFVKKWHLQSIQKAEPTRNW